MLKPIRTADGKVEIHYHDDICDHVVDALSPSEALDFFNELGSIVSEGKG